MSVSDMLEREGKYGAYTPELVDFEFYQRAKYLKRYGKVVAAIHGRNFLEKLHEEDERNNPDCDIPSILNIIRGKYE
jgi:hypothetical protein